MQEIVEIVALLASIVEALSSVVLAVVAVMEYAKMHRHKEDRQDSDLTGGQ